MTDAIVGLTVKLDGEMTKIETLGKKVCDSLAIKLGEPVGDGAKLDVGKRKVVVMGVEEGELVEVPLSECVRDLEVVLAVEVGEEVGVGGGDAEEVGVGEVVVVGVDVDDMVGVGEVVGVDVALEVEEGELDDVPLGDSVGDVVEVGVRVGMGYEEGKLDEAPLDVGVELTQGAGVAL